MITSPGSSESGGLSPSRPPSPVEEVVDLYRKKVERARYETRQAEARYRHVDPSNRLVAATLEADWNNALVALSQAQEELLAKETEKAAQVDTQTAEALLALPDLFGRLWNDWVASVRSRSRRVQRTSSTERTPQGPARETEGGQRRRKK